MGISKKTKIGEETLYIKESPESIHPQRGARVYFFSLGEERDMPRLVFRALGERKDKNIPLYQIER
jgi:hypothetical protein